MNVANRSCEAEPREVLQLADSLEVPCPYQKLGTIMAVEVPLHEPA